ncbi:DUF362 domain-containing protein [Mycoplasmatota bacterium]|nr:DUF362 domain-containing protein [Mycoplasmatota bacterium]
MRTRKSTKSSVSITHSIDECIAIEKGLKSIHINKLIKSKDTVVIVPNWVNYKKPDPKDAVVVGQNSLRTIIEIVKSSNPKNIIVATGSDGDKTSKVMKKVGYKRIIDETEAKFIDLNYGPYFEISLNNKRPSSTEINKIIELATVIISFTPLKHHEESTMSGSITNIALGLPPAEIHGYPKKNLGIHEDLHGFITAMAERIAIDISIVSCDPVMIGKGPSNGIARHANLVICGTDPVATDTVAARLLGFKPQAIQYLFNCGKLNIGETDLEKIDIKGIGIKKAEGIFSQNVYGEEIVID